MTRRRRARRLSRARGRGAQRTRPAGSHDDSAQDDRDPTSAVARPGIRASKAIRRPPESRTTTPDLSRVLMVSSSQSAFPGGCDVRSVTDASDGHRLGAAGDPVARRWPARPLRRRDHRAGRCGRAAGPRRPSRRLLKQGADVNAPAARRRDRAALGGALGRSRQRRRLLRAGADVNAANDHGVTAAGARLRERQRRRSSSGCLKAGANAERRHLVRRDGADDGVAHGPTSRVVEALLARGANVNASRAVPRPDGPDVGGRRAASRRRPQR